MKSLTLRKRKLNAKSKIILLTFLIISLILIFTLAFLTKTNTKLLSYLLNWLGILVYLYAIYTWKILSKTNFFSPYFIFLTFFIIFNFGQPIMWAFGIHTNSEIGIGEIFYRSGIYPTEYDLIFVKLFIVISTLMFHFGVLFSSRFLKVRSLSFKNNDYIKLSLKRIGLLLGTISIPATLYRSILFYNFSRIYGYNSLYYSNEINQGGILMILEIFFFPSLICILLGSEYSKWSKRFVYLIFAFYMFINLLSGDRGSWLYKLIILIWLSSSYYKKISTNKFVFLFFLSLIGLYLMDNIVSVRDNFSSGISISNTFNINQNPIVKTFFEMGSSMRVITYLLLIGKNIWHFGNTYLVAFVGMFSSRLVNILGLPFILVDDWFSQTYLGLNYGTGFSMVGEAFINGGILYSQFYLFILGLVISQFININIDKDNELYLLNYFIVSTSLNSLIGYTRGSIYLYLKSVMYGTVIISFIVVLYCRYLKNRDNIQNGL